MPFDTIIFDCDGTLADTEHMNNKACADLLHSYGFSKYTTEYSMEHFIGQTLTDITLMIEAADGIQVPKSFIPDYIALVSSRQLTELQAVPGAAEAVRELDRSYKTCVGSNGERANVINSITGIGLFDLFGIERIFTKIQVARGKPAPDLFLFAAEKMGSKPGTCIVIEDSVAGVMAGVAAGMHVIGFTGANHDPAGTAPKLTAAGAHVIMSTWPDIVHYISGLNSQKMAQ